MEQCPYNVTIFDNYGPSPGGLLFPGSDAVVGLNGAQFTGQVIGAANPGAPNAGDAELRALVEAQSKQITELTKTVGELQSRNGGNQGFLRKAA